MIPWSKKKHCGIKTLRKNENLFVITRSNEIQISYIFQQYSGIYRYIDEVTYCKYTYILYTRIQFHNTD